MAGARGMALRARRAGFAAALLCLAALLPGCQCAEVVPGLAAAEAAQAKGQEPSEPVISQVIPQAGPAQLARCAGAPFCHTVHFGLPWPF